MRAEKFGTVQGIRVAHESYGVLVHLVLYERHQSPAQSQPYVGNHIWHVNYALCYGIK